MIGSILSIQARCVCYWPKTTGEANDWGLRLLPQVILQSDAVMPIGITTELLV